MRRNFTESQQQWFWISLGACVSIGGGVLTYRMQKRKRAKTCHNLRGLAKTELCNKDGPAILKCLSEAQWNQATTQFLKRLDFKRVSQLQLRVFACELWTALKKDIKSLQVVLERFRNANEITQFVRTILEADRRALTLLKPFASDILGCDVEKRIVCAKAQSYSHSLSFLSNNGSCVEVISALAVNIPVRRYVFKTLAEDLVDCSDFKTEEIAFLDLLGSPSEDFNKLTLKALNKALRLGRTSWTQIESSAKILQESEKLFWEFVMYEFNEIERLGKDSIYTNYERMSMPLPSLDGILTSSQPSIDVRELGRFFQTFRDTIRLSKIDSKPKQSIDNQNVLQYPSHYSEMTMEQLDTEILEISKQMETMLGNFNSVQDFREVRIRESMQRSPLSLNAGIVTPGNFSSISSGLMRVKEGSVEVDDDENGDLGI